MFISFEYISYLELENTDGLNLYAHCENDSINYWDSTDHFMISKDVLICVIIGTFLGAGVMFGIAAYYGHKDDSEIFNGSFAWSII